MNERQPASIEKWRAELWELIEQYKTGANWPEVSARDRIKHHIKLMPTVPDPLFGFLRSNIRYAEWQDKHINPYESESYQNWKLTLYLPVPLSEPDKSPEAALERLLSRLAGPQQGDER